jgi:hypothetical protein
MKKHNKKCIFTSQWMKLNDTAKGDDYEILKRSDDGL